MNRDASENPRNLFPEVLDCFSLPDSPRNRICLSPMSQKSKYLDSFIVVVVEKNTIKCYGKTSVCRFKSLSYYRHLAASPSIGRADS